MIQFVTLLAGFCVPASALAQNVLPNHLASMMERQPDMALRRILDDFLGIAPDGRLTPDDLAYAEARAAAWVRAESLATILVFDLDGDGAISADEVAAHRRHAAPNVLLDLEYILADLDGDGDGALSAPEIATPDPAGDAGSYGLLGLDYLAMDLDGDGEVVTAEVVEALRGMAAAEPVPVAEAPVECTYPAPSAEAEIVLLAGYEANMLSPVTLVGQDGITGAGTILIEEGAPRSTSWLSPTSPRSGSWRGRPGAWRPSSCPITWARRACRASASPSSPESSASSTSPTTLSPHGGR